MESEREDRESLVKRAVADELSVLTVQDVAALLKVKPSWIYDKVEAGEFPVVRLGRQLRFRTADIREYVEARYEPASVWLHLSGRRAHDASRRLGRPRRRTS